MVVLVSFLMSNIITFIYYNYINSSFQTIQHYFCNSFILLAITIVAIDTATIANIIVNPNINIDINCFYLDIFNIYCQIIFLYYCYICDIVN